MALLVFTSTQLAVVAPPARAASTDSDEASNPVVIEVATIGAQELGGWFLEQINRFEQAHPSIRVRAYDVGEPRRTAAPLDSLPEIGLNVIGLSSERGFEILPLIENSLIVPIDQFLPDAEFSYDAYYENLWDIVRYAGSTWGVPFACNPPVFLCDWDLFEAEGILDPPASWEDVRDHARRLTKDTDGDGDIDQWGLRLGIRGQGGYMSYLWQTMVLQEGATFFRDGRFDLSDAACEASFTKLVELATEESGAHVDDRKLPAVINDPNVKYAMQLSPVHYLDATYGKQNYRIVPWPTSGNRVIMSGRRHYLAIGRSTAEREQASWEFVKWITGPEVSVPGHVDLLQAMCRTDVAAAPRFQAATLAYCDGFDVMQETKGWMVMPMPPSRVSFESVLLFESIMHNLFAGKTTFDGARKRIEQECNGLLRAAAPSVQPFALYREVE